MNRHDVRPLLGDRFAPTTSSIGFLRLSLSQATDALVAWRTRLYASVEVEPLEDELSSMLPRIAPLMGGTRPRELLVECGDHVAYFDCLLQGTDADSAIGALTEQAGTTGLAIRYSLRRPEAVQFQMFGPLRTDFINYVRTVAVTQDEGRWHFDLTGTEQPFEDTARYQARRIRDRFDGSMLRDYCRALGVDPFTESSYGPRGVLVHSPLPPAPGGYVMSYDEVQRWLGITPMPEDKAP